jgi:hypothetical protein
MHMNSIMREILSRPLRRDLDTELPSDTQWVIDSGWVVGPAGSLLLATQYRPSWHLAVEPVEIGNFEYEINDIWISAADLSDDRSDIVHGGARRGIGFAIAVMRKAVGLPGSEQLAALVSVPVEPEYIESGVTVKLFTKRGAYPEWVDDLEPFQLDGVALVEVSDTLSPEGTLA